MLEEDGIYNAICPKAPGELKKRMKEEKFVELQTEALANRGAHLDFQERIFGQSVVEQGAWESKPRGGLERAGAQSVGDRAAAARRSQGAGQSELSGGSILNKTRGGKRI